MNCADAEPLLHARLDNELDVASSSSIDRHLAECRDCAIQYAALENLHDEIAAADLAYMPDAAFERKLGDRLLGEKKPSFSPWGILWRTAGLVAGAAACIVLSILAVSLTRRPAEPDAIGAEILDSHLRALQPGHLVDVPSSDQHTVKPWFQGKTSFSPPVPDLSGQGFVLAGGRLEVIHRQPTAAIVYLRRQHVVSLYVSPVPGADAKAEFRDLGGYHLLHWTQNNLSYWAASDVDAGDLRQFADLIRGR